MPYAHGCPYCGGLVVDQPGRLACRLCGREWRKEHVGARERRLERAISRQLTRWQLYEQPVDA